MEDSSHHPYTPPCIPDLHTSHAEGAVWYPPLTTHPGQCDLMVMLRVQWDKESGCCPLVLGLQLCPGPSPPGRWPSPARCQLPGACVCPTAGNWLLQQLQPVPREPGGTAGEGIPLCVCSGAGTAPCGGNPTWICRTRSLERRGWAEDRSPPCTVGSGWKRASSSANPMPRPSLAHGTEASRAGQRGTGEKDEVLRVASSK